jgi:uncharacterized membrane protein
MQASNHQGGAPIFFSSDRLASLSDTMFGVAMTLVATTLLPSIQAHKGSVVDMWPAMQSELITVVLSFTISARYWVSQQQRLAMTSIVTPWQITLHLVFLFLIVLVPISTSLPGLVGGGTIRTSVLIYGLHLVLIGLMNLLLWIEVHRNTAAHEQIARSALALLAFLAGLAVGAVRPDLASYLWAAALAAGPAGRRLAQRWARGRA